MNYTNLKELIMMVVLGFLVALAGAVGISLRNIYKRHIDSQEKADAANTAVLFVEQVYKALHGPQKLEEALDVAQRLLEKKGIPFDKEEMKALIEAAVAAFSDAFYKSEDAIQTESQNEGCDELSQAVEEALEGI